MRRFFYPVFIHTPATTLIFAPSLARETRCAPGVECRRRRRVGSTAVVLLGDEPPDPGLDQAFGANADPW
jgi:hypothetical protein